MREWWERTRIADLVEPITTIDPRKRPDGIFTYIDVSSISRETFEIVETTQLKGADAPSRARRLVKQGDIIFATIRPTLQRIAEVPKALDGAVCSTGYFVLRPKPKVLTRFLFYSLFTPEFFDAMAELQRGAAYPAVSDADVRDQKLSVPPIPEQRRIVAILDEAFAGIATAVANTEKNLANARELFESYLHAATDAAFSSGEIAVLADLATEITDGDHMPPPKAPSGIPFVTIKNIDKKTRKIDFEDTFSVPRDYFEMLKANKRPQEGDVLYTVTGSFGIPVLVEKKTEFCFQRHIGLIRPRADTNSRWLYYLLLSPQLFAQATERATGTAQKTVSLKVLRSFRVPVIQWNQQLDVVKGLDEISAEAERLESIYQQKLTALAEFKQSLLQKAFSGELTATPQDEIETALA